MLAKNLISSELPPLKGSDDGHKAMAWLQEFHAQYLPVIDGNRYVGLISEFDILDMNDLDMSVGDYPLHQSRPFVHESDHIYEVIRTINEHRLPIMPVISQTDEYIGVITVKDLLEYFTNINSLHEPGGIVILEMPVIDYSVVEIAQIVEGNDARILSMYMKTHPDGRTMDVTIKMNRKDLSKIVASFERYGYTIKDAYQETGYTQEVQDRYDSFMNYLNI